MIRMCGLRYLSKAVFIDPILETSGEYPLMQRTQPDACDESQPNTTIAILSVLVGLGLLVLAFRFFSRVRGPNGLMADDYTMFIAVVSPSVWKIIGC